MVAGSVDHRASAFSARGFDIWSKKVNVRCNVSESTMVADGLASPLQI
jgi:hypothetical protein